MDDEHNSSHDSVETQPLPALGGGPPEPKVIERLRAFCGDAVSKGCTRMTIESWKRQKLSKRDAEMQPEAIAFAYGGSLTIRALYASHTQVGTAKRGYEADGVWLTAPVVTTGIYASVQQLDGPRPYVPGSATAANSGNGPLHITDREDVAAILAFSGEAAIAVAKGASLFSNPESVDALCLELPRPLHPACGNIALGAREIRFVFEDRTEALYVTRGLRQGQAHTGTVSLLNTSTFLNQIDSAISQGYDTVALKEFARDVCAVRDEDIGAIAASGDPGSVGMHVHPEALKALPSAVRDLKWPILLGAGQSNDNPLWFVCPKTHMLYARVDTQRSAEFTTSQTTPVLRAPIFVTRRFTTTNKEEPTKLELMWSKETPHGPQMVVQQFAERALLGGQSNVLCDTGLGPDKQRAARWLQHFVMVNTLPETELSRHAGWVTSGGRQRFLVPGAEIEGKELEQDVLTGFCSAGDPEDAWKYFGDYYRACDPVNQLMLVAAQASILLAYLKRPGCTFCLSDESSSGKSVFMHTAAALFGRRSEDYYHVVSTPPTKAFMERFVQAHNGLCVLLDDVQNIPSKSGERGQQNNTICREELAYLLTNGERRGRGGADGKIDATKERVHCYALMAGESKYMTDLERAEQREGADVRNITLPMGALRADFLAAYGGLSGYMAKAAHTYGHVGRTLISAIEDLVNSKTLEELREELQETTTRLERRFAEASKGSAASQRRALFIAPIVYMEMYLAKAFPNANLWQEDFEETCVMRALRGPHAARLLDIKHLHDPTTVDSLPAKLLEAIRQDPRLIRGLADEGDYKHPSPLGELNMHPRSLVKGMRLYPNAVAKFFKADKVGADAVFKLLANSGMFITGKDGRVTVRSNTQYWITPVAGWAWQLYYQPEGTPDREAKDPNHRARTEFEAYCTRENDPKRSPTENIIAAIDAYLGDMPLDDDLEPGTILYQLKHKAEDMWSAILLPQLDRREDKPGCEVDTDMCFAHIQRVL